MTFISIPFTLLFLFVFIFRSTVGRIKVNKLYFAILLFASLLFYLWDEPANIIVLLSSTILNYLGGWGIGLLPLKSKRRKGLLILVIFINLAILGYFKYTTFLLSNIAALGFIKDVHTNWQTGLVLPLGISFFTFQAMSYAIDVYFQRLQIQKNFAHFLLYVSFFPKLVSGPIIRSGDFFQEMREPIPFNLSSFNHGIYLIIQGVFLKLICADNLAVIVNKYWGLGSNPDAHSLDLLLLSVLFAFQIFCDFAGYTNIARGVAHIFGFRLPINFLYPYTVGSFTGFWRNWHISLSEWIRVYLFYPLERISRRKLWLYLTPIIVMLLVGLWHGANWTFIVWGLLYGIGMSAERILGLNRPTSNIILRILWVPVTQIGILIGWIIFRSETLPGAFGFIKLIVVGAIKLHRHHFGFTNDFLNGAFPTIAYWRSLPNATAWDGILPVLLDLLPIITVLAIHIYGLLSKRGLVPEMNGWARAVLAGALLFFCLAAYPSVNTPFVYFQF